MAGIDPDGQIFVGKGEKAEYLTLKLATASPPASSRKAQQRAFDRFRLEYNEQRPHEALEQRFPADFYCRSQRVLLEPYWGRDFDYPEDYERSRVRNSGHLAWNDRSVFISAALKHQWLGLQWQTNGSWRVFFCQLPIGTLSGSRFTPR